MDLIQTAHIDDPDRFYEELVDAQRSLTDEQARMMNAKLVLILANHIGDRQVLSQALLLAQPASGR